MNILARISKDLSIVSLLHLLGIIISLTSVPIIINKIGLEEFGYYVYWISIFTLSGMLVSFGVENVQFHKIVIEINRRNEILIEALAVRTIPFLFLIIASLIAVKVQKTEHSTVIFQTYLIYIFSSLINIAWFQYAMNEAVRASTLELISKMLFLVSFLFLADTFTEALAIYSIIQLFTSIIFLCMGIKHLKKTNKEMLLAAPKFNKNNFNIILAGLVSLPLNQLIPVFTMHVFGPVFVGHFGIMEKIASGIKSLYVPLTKVITPLITKKINKEITWGFIFKAGSVFMFSSSLLIVTLNLFANEILSILTKDQFTEDYIKLFRIYSITVPIVVTLTFLGTNIILGLGMSHSYRNSAIMGSLVFLPLLLLVFLFKSMTLFFMSIIAADLTIFITLIISLKLHMKSESIVNSA